MYIESEPYNKLTQEKRAHGVIWRERDKGKQRRELRRDGPLYQYTGCGAASGKFVVVQWIGWHHARVCERLYHRRTA